MGNGELRKREREISDSNLTLYKFSKASFTTLHTNAIFFLFLNGNFHLNYKMGDELYNR